MSNSRPNTLEQSSVSLHLPCCDQRNVSLQEPAAHTVCVCTLHQNTKLMFTGSKLATLSDGAFLHYGHCVTAIQCNPASIKCYF